MKGSKASRYGLPEDAINKILLVLADYPGVERVILYGSRAKGNFRPGSDIYLCLQAPAFSLTEKLGIEAELDALLLPWKIDLVLVHKIANPALLEHIERIGIELFQPEPKTSFLKCTQTSHHSTQ